MEAKPGTAARGEARPADDPRPRLVTRPLLVRFVSTVGVAASFYLLLSTVPEYTRAVGVSAGTAGLTTTALTLSSVAAYLVAPRLMARYGYRRGGERRAVGSVPAAGGLAGRPRGLPAGVRGGRCGRAGRAGLGAVVLTAAVLFLFPAVVLATAHGSNRK